MSEPTTKIPHIKADAQVPVVLTSGTIAELQSVLMYILDSHSKEDIEAFQSKLSASKELSIWESSAFAMVRLLKVIHDAAVTNDQVVYKDIDSSLSGLIH